MGRWIFTVLSTISLVLCVASVTLGYRSFRHCDLFEISLPQTFWATDTFYVMSAGRGIGGGFCGLHLYAVTRQHLCFTSSVGTCSYGGGGWRVTSAWDHLGFDGLLEHGKGHRFYVILVPWWFPMLATSLLPAWWLRSRWNPIRDESQVERACLACGYDLRATLGRCPECGMAPKTLQIAS